MMNKKILINKEDSVDIYMKDVRKTIILKPEEERELCKRISEGDSIALDKLVTSNLRFVIKVAKEYQNRGISISDLINEGNYGLIVAAKKYDLTKGVRFLSYAIWWIRQSILQSLNDNSRTVRLPNNIITKLNKIKKQKEENVKLGKETLVDDLQVPSCTSLNRIISDNGDELLSLLEDKFFSSPDELSEEVDNMRKNELGRAMKGLSNREINIVNMYFGIFSDPMTLETIGQDVNLTKERVRQIKEGAIRKIRNNLGGYFCI
jgi:RNA polymerase primary sigma factor